MLGSPHRDPDQLSQWIEHHPRLSALLLYCSFLVVDIFRLFHDDVVTAIVSSIFFCSVLVIWLRASSRHSVGVCARCLDAPMGSPDHAERHALWLQLSHYIRERPLKYFLFHVGLLVMVVTIGFVVDNLLVTYLLFIPLFTVIATTNHITRVHSWLRPWCPWCKSGGGGDFEDAPTPDPVGVKQG